MSHENHCVQLLPPMTLCLKHLGQKSHPSCEDFDKWISCVPGPPLSCRVPVSAPQTAPQKVDTCRRSSWRGQQGKWIWVLWCHFIQKWELYLSRENQFSKRREGLAFELESACARSFIRNTMPDNPEWQSCKVYAKPILPFFCHFLSFFWLLIVERFKHKCIEKSAYGYIQYPSLRF